MHWDATSRGHHISHDRAMWVAEGGSRWGSLSWGFLVWRTGEKRLSELRGSLGVSDWVCRKWGLSYRTILMWGSRLVGVRRVRAGWSL